jgi:hypothetical protein
VRPKAPASAVALPAVSLSSARVIHSRWSRRPASTFTARPDREFLSAIHRGTHSPIAPPARVVWRGLVSGRKLGSRLDRVLSPRRPVLRRAIAGIASDRISVTGTGVRRIGRSTLISIARSTGISGLPRVAWRRIGRGSGVGVSRVAWRSVTRGGVGGLSCVVSIARRSGVSGVSRVALIAIAGLGVARISVRRRSVSRVAVGWVAVGWVAEIGAGWGRWCTCDSPKYPGCPSDCCSEGGSGPATRRCSNGSTRSRSQYATTKATLNRIIRVGAGREAQRRHDNQIGRYLGHYPSSLSRRPG